MVGRTYLGKYETVRLLGEGGMGRVYLARQTDLAGRQVVVKVMHDHIAADPHFSQQFQREIHLMARFQHPYAVNLYDASGDGQPEKCIIMEYVRGITVEQLLKQEQRLHPARVGRMLGQLAEVLQAAHHQGIIHRDLKPSNLMIVDGGTPYEKLKVMDFGLVKLVSNSTATNADGEFALGTPNYMSPEQARNESSLDFRSDIYSTGVILFELLSGRLPFTGGSAMDIMLAHATEKPPSFAQVGAGEWVPRSIEGVVHACLAKAPADRPKSARELAERYEAALANQYSSRSGGDTADKTTEITQQQSPKPKSNPAAVNAPDPNTIQYHVEAWMPERIAAYKLQGFVYDAGGEVVECVPGLIRVRLGARGTPYGPRGGALGWLSLGKRRGPIDVTLHLEKADPARENLLSITILFRSPDGELPSDPHWKARCDHVFIDLRAYLMGSAATTNA